MPTEVANAVRLQEPEVQPCREESRAMPQHTVLYGAWRVQNPTSAIPLALFQGSSRSGEGPDSWK